MSLIKDSLLFTHGVNSHGNMNGMVSGEMVTKEVWFLIMIYMEIQNRKGFRKKRVLKEGWSLLEWLIRRDMKGQ